SLERLEHEARLDGSAAPELDDPTAGSHDARDFPDALAQDAEFGSRQVVLVDLADALEQTRSDFVVEELAGQPLRALGKPGQHLLPDHVDLGRRIDVA